jgi:hypothetical protein
VKRNTLIIIFVVCLIGFLIWLLKEPPVASSLARKMETAQTSNSIETNIATTPSQSSVASDAESRFKEGQSQMERIKRDSEAEVAKWKSTIIYYGKVIDEDGNPIQGANVSYNASALDNAFNQAQITGTVTSDDRGIFKIDGINGYTLMFQVSHSDYYSYPDNSTGFSKGSLPRKGYFSDTEDKAEIFRMHRKGNSVPLVHRRGGADVPVNAGLATVNFYGEQDRQVMGTLQIQARGDTPKNWSPTPYDWSVQLTVPNGGLVESTNQFDFLAPNTGYQSVIEIHMDKTQPVWSDTVVKTYFVKIATGYLRMGIRMRAKTPLYVSVDYYYNPDGSTNLESDK